MVLELRQGARTVQGRVHIQPTDLALERGTMNVLLGPTLSGKASMKRLMAGLDVPTAGCIFWNGTDVAGQRVQDRKVAMVYQQVINYPAMTVYANIASPMRLLGKTKAEIDRAGRETTEMLPVDQWGIRVNENSQPVVSCVARGGSTNDAAAVYDVTKAIEWWQKYSPPEAAGMTVGEAGPVPVQGAKTPQEALDALCAPMAKLETGDEDPKTIAYEKLIKSWQN